MKQDTTRNWVVSALYGADDPKPMTPTDAVDLISTWINEGSITPDDLPDDYNAKRFADTWNEMLPTFKHNDDSATVPEKQNETDTRTFKLHTYDIQDIVIALIDSRILCCKHSDDMANRMEKLQHLFADLNTLVNESNNWTLTFTVKA